MLMCNDCKSTNIIDTEEYGAYFREGQYLRFRMIIVWQNQNTDCESWFAMCPELSKKSCAVGNTKISAIKNLGNILEKVCSVILMGKMIDDN